MKNLFSMLVLVICGLLIGFGFNSIEASPTQHSSVIIAQKEKVAEIYSINKIIVKDTAQNAGLCDTCHTSYKSAIIENRIMANQISAQNYRMSEIIQRNETEISRLENVAVGLVKLRKKYELDLANIERRNQENKIFYSHAQFRN